MIFLWLLAFVPLSVVLAYAGAPPLWVFLTALVALVPLAEFVRKATDQLAKLAGSAIGGLLNVTFGNVPELVLAMFVLSSGAVDVVKAQITGAIIGNSLLGLGLCIVVGSWGREKQTFRRERAGLQGSLLMITVIALLLPALFHIAERGAVDPAVLLEQDQKLSYGVAVILIAVYICNLLYTFVTHRDVFASTKAEEAAEWSCKKAIGVLVVATLGTALEAELISKGLGDAAGRLGLSPVFIGIVLLAVAGNASEYFSAVYFAKENRMGMALSITMGSTIQIALLVAPLLVLLSGLTGHRLNLVFSHPLEMIAIAGSAFAVNAIAQDGETTWFEGVMLLAVYAICALGFFYATR
jgi:Ca2+:H+ antiporter